MKVSQLTVAEIASYLHLDGYDTAEATFLGNLKSAAVDYVCSYTGLTASDLDWHSDIATAVLVLIQDMYDNRALYVDKSNVNRLVTSILGLHSVNLV